MGEHVEDANMARTDSYMHKHWCNQHNGVRTTFSFKILSFYSSPLERQVGEAVRVMRTGAAQILNSKGVYNTCSLPRIVAQDSKETNTLGDMGVTTEEEGGEVGDLEPVQALEPKLSRREVRNCQLRDLEEWGNTPAEVDVHDAQGEGYVVDDDILGDGVKDVDDLDILSEGDDSLIECLDDLFKSSRYEAATIQTSKKKTKDETKK